MKTSDGRMIAFGTEVHNFIDISPPRLLNTWERDAINLLLSRPFENRESAVSQSNHLQVVQMCTHCPTVKLHVSHLDVDTRLRDLRGMRQGITPYELIGESHDGIPIEVFLHVTCGLLSKLEVFRADLEPLFDLPDLGTLTLMLD